jgi:hypothetical protein
MRYESSWLLHPFLLAIAACGEPAPTSPVVAVVDAYGNTRCSAFATRGVLLTAAHCVPGGTDNVSYRRRASYTVGVDRASVLLVNTEEDWAALDPGPGAALPEFALAEPQPGAVSTQAAIADWETAEGILGESYFAGDSLRWSAALDVEPGWSGSPILQNGHAIGILQTCRGAEWPSKSCVRPGFVTFFPVLSATKDAL